MTGHSGVKETHGDDAIESLQDLLFFVGSDWGRWDDILAMEERSAGTGQPEWSVHWSDPS